MVPGGVCCRRCVDRRERDRVVWCNSVMLDQPSVCMPSQGTCCPCHRPLAISRRAFRTAALQAVNPPPASIDADAPDRTTPFSQARGLDRPRLWLPAACLLCTCCCRSLALARRRPRHSWPQTPSPAGRLAQLPPQQQPRHQSLLPGQVKGRPFRAPRPEENPPRLIGPSRSPRPAAAQPTAPATTECRRRTTASEGGGGPCNRSALEFSVLCPSRRRVRSDGDEGRPFFLSLRSGSQVNPCPSRSLPSPRRAPNHP